MQRAFVDDEIHLAAREAGQARNLPLFQVDVDVRTLAAEPLNPAWHHVAALERSGPDGVRHRGQLLEERLNELEQTRNNYSTNNNYQ